MDTKIPFGRVVLDATPVELPTRLTMPASRADQIREFIRHEISMQAAAQGHETFEEADDFSIEEGEPLTKYELAMLDGEIAPIVDRIVADRRLRAAPADRAEGDSGVAAPPVVPAATSSEGMASE